MPSQPAVVAERGVPTSPKGCRTTALALPRNVFEPIFGTVDVCVTHVGDRLGYCQQLAEHGPLTPHDLADRAGTVGHQTRAWLEMQAVAGYLQASEGEPRRFSMPEGHAEALTDRLSLG